VAQRWMLGVLALVALNMVGNAPLASASVHGVDWVAIGVWHGATDKVMQLDWNGCLGCFFGTYTVHLTDPSTLAVTQVSLAGTIQQYSSSTDPLGYTDLLIMVGNANGLTFQSEQYAGINSGPHFLTQVMVGTYQGATFALATAPFTWQPY